jgi:membrane-associated phospholipid phosphatase
MSHAFARNVSILGHPLATLPAALALATTLQRHDPAGALRIVAGALAIGAVVMLASWRRVRSGRWAHVDASAPGERRELNRGLLVGLSIAALLAWTIAHDAFTALALALGAALIALALLTARAWTLSLHVAFAVFAAMLLRASGMPALAAGLAFAALVGWSRLRLGRHRPRDLVAGTGAGLVAGLVHAGCMGGLPA